MNHKKEVYPNLSKTDFATCISGGLNRLSRKIDGIYRKNLKPFEITVSQLNILSTVGQFWEMEQSQVGKVLMMERSTVSRDLKRLIKRGLIHQSGRVNRRLLTISQEGAIFLENIIPFWEKAMQESSTLLGEKGVKDLGAIQQRL